jgi:regulator of replication initiation timing
MTDEIKKLVKEITIIEKRISKLNRMINKTISLSNAFKMEVVTLRDKLKEKHLLLKEISERNKLNKEITNNTPTVE